MNKEPAWGSGPVVLPRYQRKKGIEAKSSIHTRILPGGFKHCGEGEASERSV